MNLHPKGEPTRAALVDLVGPPVEVTPTDDVEVTRSGETVEVSRAVTGDRTADTLVVERADSAERRLIAEQVMRRRNTGLRNTLPFFEAGVSRIRLTTGEQGVDEALGFDDEPRRFRYDGTSYVARRTD